MIGPDLIKSIGAGRKPTPVFDFGIVAELSALHELSALAFAESEQKLAQEATEKVIRLFGARYFAVLSGKGDAMQPIICSGFKTDTKEEVWARMASPGKEAHQLILTFNEGTDDQDLVFFEQARPLDSRACRLFNVFARRLEDRLAALRSEMRRREIEKQLRRSETRFLRALEYVPVVIAIYNADLRIQYINSAITTFTGRPTSNYTGKQDDEIWPPAVSKICLPLLRKAFETGLPQSLKTPLPLKTHETRTVHLQYVPLIGEDGAVNEVVHVMEEITGQKEIEP